MKKLLKWLAFVAGGIVALLIIGGAVAFTVSSGKINATFDVAAHSIAVPTDPASLERGRHLTEIIGCAECHDAGFGGKVLIDQPPLAVVYSPNLTAGEGGALRRYDDAGLERAIRHGIGDDGRSLIVMPSPDYAHLSDSDVGAIIAWLRQAGPVDNVLPAPKFGPLGRVLIATDQMPGLLVAGEVDHSAVHTARPPAEGPTVEYGGYLAQVCAGCHRRNFAGTREGGPDGSPPALNLTPAGRVGAWSLDEFITTLRTGVTPNGYALNAEFMPWPVIAKATDIELEAIYNYLRSLPQASPE